MQVQEAKSRLKILCPYIYEVKFLALLGAPYTYDISRLRVNLPSVSCIKKMTSGMQANFLLTTHSPEKRCSSLTFVI
jgi:hypothetical protein